MHQQRYTRGVEGGVFFHANTWVIYVKVAYLGVSEDVTEIPNEVYSNRYVGSPRTRDDFYFTPFQYIYVTCTKHGLYVCSGDSVSRKRSIDFKYLHAPLFVTAFQIAIIFHKVAPRSPILYP